jgi:hypothetical protein
MKKILVTIFLPLAYIAFFVPLAGKTTNPAIFNNNLIQYGASAIVAIACPICILCSLYILLEQYRILGLLLVVLSSFPLIIAAILLCVMPTILGRSAYTIFQPDFHDIDVIASAERLARSPETDLNERIKSASVLYRYWNVTTTFLDSDKILRVYTPTASDQLERKNNSDLRVKEEATRNMIDQTMQQIPWIFGIYLTAFIFVMGAALTVLAIRRLRHDALNKFKSPQLA